MNRQRVVKVGGFIREVRHTEIIRMDQGRKHSPSVDAAHSRNFWAPSLAAILHSAAQRMRCCLIECARAWRSVRWPALEWRHRRRDRDRARRAGPPGLCSPAPPDASRAWRDVCCVEVWRLQSRYVV
jgi:hypothetical protein